jgi:predicted component of type VI protein secretion system
LPADKKRKFENVSLLNQWLRLGQFKVPSGSRFQDDSFLVEIDREKSTPDRLKVKDSYHSDIIDAVLYAFRESPAYHSEILIEKPKYGTKEYYEAEADGFFDKAMEHFSELEHKEPNFYENEDF